MKDNCLSEELIARYAEGIASKTEQMLVMDHCRICKSCSEEVVATIQFLYQSSDISLSEDDAKEKEETKIPEKNLTEIQQKEGETTISSDNKFKINPIVWLVAACFLILFLAGFLHAHIRGVKPENLRSIASQHIHSLNDQNKLVYAFEDEIFVYNKSTTDIQIHPNTPNIKEQLTGNGSDIMEASAGYVGMGVIITKVFRTKMSGKNAVYYYIGATVAIVGGYGLGYYIHEKYFPIQKSKAMKRFLRDKENWRVNIRTNNIQ